MVQTDELFSLCRKSNAIYIYGAGKNAALLYRYLEGNAIHVDGFIVSTRQKNPLSFFGIPVVLADAHDQASGELILSSVLPRRPGYTEILDAIIRLGWRNVFFFSDSLFSPIRSWNIPPKQEISFRQGEYYVDSSVPVEQDHSILVMEKDGERYRWRVENESLKKEFKDINEVFSGKSAIEEFEEQYGEYLVLQDFEDKTAVPDASLLVYMTRSHADHPAKLPSLADWVVPIQVGAALTEKIICEVRDNEGDNISARNHLYSEATALYWMWKNAPETDYIGLCHYRRHIDLPRQDPRILAANRIDVLVTAPTFEPNGLINIFLRFIPHSDIDLLLQKIREQAPDYYPYAQQFFKSRFYPPCNIAVMRSCIFREYAQYLFSVVFAIDRFYQERGLMRHDRYMGFLVECLLGIFLMRHRDEYRIAYADMLFYYPEA